MKRVWAACRAAAFTRARLGGRAIRPSVRPLASPLGVPSGRPLPSAHLVSFDGVIGTMNRSDSRPSARAATPAVPRCRPPPETSPAAPVGPLMFRRLPSMRDPAFDPGGASPSRVATAIMLPSWIGNPLGLRELPPFEAQSRTPYDPCLHFRPRVAATPARLGPGSPATALAGWDLHPQAIISLA